MARDFVDYKEMERQLITIGYTESYLASLSNSQLVELFDFQFPL